MLYVFNLLCFRGDEGVDVVPNFDWICPREKVVEEVSKTLRIEYLNKSQNKSRKWVLQK